MALAAKASPIAGSGWPEAGPLSGVPQPRSTSKPASRQPRMPPLMCSS